MLEDGEGRLEWLLRGKDEAGTGEGEGGEDEYSRVARRGEPGECLREIGTRGGKGENVLRLGG